MTSLTQRSSGLVQRRTEASRNAADKERAGGGGGGSGEDDAQSRRDEQDDDDKGDSKETRLTLMEEVLLLGLKDREVRVRRAGGGGLQLGSARLPSERPGAPRWPGVCRDCLGFPSAVHLASQRSVFVPYFRVLTWWRFQVTVSSHLVTAR